MVRLPAEATGIRIETADMLVREILPRGSSEIEERWRATPGSRDRPTRAV